MSRYGICPECGIGDLYINEYIPDWGTEANVTYKLSCNHCDYNEEADWFDPDDDEDCEED